MVGLLLALVGVRPLPATAAEAWLVVQAVAPTYYGGKTYGTVDVGDQVSWDIKYLNANPVAVRGLTIDSPQFAAQGVVYTCPDVEMANRAPVVTCTPNKPYTVTEADVRAGQARIPFEANAQAPGYVVPPGTSAAAVATIRRVGWELDQGLDPDSLSGAGTARPGDELIFEYELRNTWNVDITVSSISSPLLTAAGIEVTCPATALPRQTSMTCTQSAPYRVTDADAVAGQIRNLVTITGTADPAAPDYITNPAPAVSRVDVPVEPRRSELSLTKHAALPGGLTQASPGDAITYSFTVTNTGNQMLSTVRVADPFLSGRGIEVSCPTTDLAPGASLSCSASDTYTVTVADLVAGSVRNEATATALAPTDAPEVVPATDTAITPTIAADTSLTLTKRAVLPAGVTEAEIGDLIDYTFTVRNAGTLTVTDPQVHDPRLSEVICPAGALAPGESVTCTVPESARYVVTRDDISAGVVRNEATATATAPSPLPDPVSAPATADVPTAAARHAHSLTLGQETEGAGPADLGASVWFTARVENTGNVAAAEIEVTGEGMTMVCPHTQLAPGTGMDCRADTAHVVTESDLLRGSVRRTAQLTSTPPSGVPAAAPVEATTTVPVATVRTALSAEKIAVPPPGVTTVDHDDPIDYRVRLTNTGNVSLTDPRVADPMLTAVGITLDCPSDPVPPEGTVTCTSSAPYRVTEADIAAGSVRNEATVSATAPAGAVDPPNPEPVSVSVQVPTVDPSVALELVTSAELNRAPSTAPLDLGDEITYRFEVLNRGSVTVSSLAIDDPMLDAVGVRVSCAPDAVAPGQRVACEVSGPYRVTEADIIAGQVENTATVTGTVPAGLTDPSASADFHWPTVAPDTTTTLVKTAELADQNGNTFADLGEWIGYEFTLTSHANITLVNPVIEDPMLDGTPIDCDAHTLPPGGELSCRTRYAGYQVTEADLLAGAVRNTASAETESPGGVLPPTPSVGSAEVMAAPTGARIAATKSVVRQSSAPASLGEAIGYTVSVTNTGNTSLTAVSVADPLVPVACPGGALAPGETRVCTSQSDHLVTSADILAGMVHNEATVTATAPELVTDPEPVIAKVDVPTAAPNPALAAVKSAVRDSGPATLGESFGYEITVTNSGNLPLTGVQVADPMLPVTCDPAPLAPGESVTCATAGRYTVTGADLAAGMIHNEATVTATGPQDDPDPVLATADVPTMIAAPGLALTKTPIRDSTDPAELGEPIDYAFEVTNTGNLPLTGVAVSDPKLAEIPISCPPGELASGASVTCKTQWAYPVSAEDLAAGVVRNQATVTAAAPDGLAAPTPAAATADVPTAAAEVALGLVVSPIWDDQDGTRGAAVGEAIDYQFTVQNAGTVPLTGLTITEPTLAAADIAVQCADQPLAPGAKTTCSAVGSYRVTEDDILAGWVQTRATAVASTPGGLPDPAPAVAIAAVPTSTGQTMLRLTKLADFPDGSPIGLGDRVDYRFELTNTGSLTLTGPRVEDPRLTGVSCPAEPLDPGRSVTCTAESYTVTAQDLAAGSVRNRATGWAMSPIGAPAPAIAVLEVPTGSVAPSLALTLTPDLPGPVGLDDLIGLTATVRNTGDVTLLHPTIAGFTCAADWVGPGESVDCVPHQPHRVTGAEIAAGLVRLTATVTASTPTGLPDPGPDTASVELPTVAPAPGLSLAKSVGTAGPVGLGDPIEYAFVLTNTGNVPLTGASVTDPLLTGVSCPDRTIDPGEHLACSGEEPYRVTEADLLAGEVLNEATASAGGASATDSVRVPTADPAVSVALIKLAALDDVIDNDAADLGEHVTYTFEVENTGTITLTDIEVTDPRLTGVSCPATPLAPGETLTCTADGPSAVTEADLIAGTVHNEATVTADSALGPPGSRSASIELPTTPATPALEIAVVAERDQDGPAEFDEPIGFRVDLTNRGNVTLTTPVLESRLRSGLDWRCGQGWIAPGSTVSCTAEVYRVTEADILAGRVWHEVTATADSPGGITDPDPASGGVEVPTATPRPGLALGLTALADSPAALDAAVEYRFDLTNTGNVTLSGVEVDDPLLATSQVAVSCPDDPIPPRGTARCVAPGYRVTEADLRAGVVHNEATVTAGSPVGASSPAADAVDLATVSAQVSMRVVKSGAVRGAQPTGSARVGDLIDFTVRVTNTGNQTLDQVTVDDPMLAAEGIAVACPTGTVPPGGAVGCRADQGYRVQATDLAAGGVRNEASARASAVGADPDPVSARTEIRVVEEPLDPPVVDPPTVEPPGTPPGTDPPVRLGITGVAVLPGALLALALLLTGAVLRITRRWSR